MENLVIIYIVISTLLFCNSILKEESFISKKIKNLGILQTLITLIILYLIMLVIFPIFIIITLLEGGSDGF